MKDPPAKSRAFFTTRLSDIPDRRIAIDPVLHSP